VGYHCINADLVVFVSGWTNQILNISTTGCSSKLYRSGRQWQCQIKHIQQTARTATLLCTPETTNT